MGPLWPHRVLPSSSPAVGGAPWLAAQAFLKSLKRSPTGFCRASGAAQSAAPRIVGLLLSSPSFRRHHCPPLLPRCGAAVAVNVPPLPLPLWRNNLAAFASSASASLPMTLRPAYVEPVSILLIITRSTPALSARRACVSPLAPRSRRILVAKIGRKSICLLRTDCCSLTTTSPNW